MRIYPFVLLAVAACVSPEQQYAEQQAQRAQYAQALKQRCAGYGFTPGTVDFANCVQQLDMQNQRIFMDAATAQSLQREQNATPLCSSLPPGVAGAKRAQGLCR